MKKLRRKTRQPQPSGCPGALTHSASVRGVVSLGSAAPPSGPAGVPSVLTSTMGSFDSSFLSTGGRRTISVLTLMYSLP